MKDQTNSRRDRLHLQLSAETERHLETLRQHYARQGIHLSKSALIRLAVQQRAEQTAAV